MLDKQRTDQPERQFLLATVGSLGDLRPLLALATALQDQGQKVELMSTPNYREMVETAGISFQAFGTVEQYESVFKNPDTWNPKRPFEVGLKSLMMPNVQSIREHIIERTKRCRLIVMSSVMMFPFVELARSEVPNLESWLVVLSPATLRPESDQIAVGPIKVPAATPIALKQRLWKWLDRRYINPVVNPAVNAIRASCDLPPISSVTEHVQKDADGLFLMYPEWFCPHHPQTAKRVFQSDFFTIRSEENRGDLHQDRELERFLGDGEAPVVFTAGSEHQHAALFFQRALEVVQTLKIRAVFVNKVRELFPAELPESVHWTPFVASFRDLLSRASAVVHHGGIGTTAESLSVGVPQLVVPFAYDQFDNAMRVESLGCGRMYPSNFLPFIGMQFHLRKVLTTSGYRTAAEDVKSIMASALHNEQWAERFLAENINRTKTLISG